MPDATLLEFVVASGMEPDAARAAGAIRAGRYLVGGAARRGSRWVAERPFGCSRVANPNLILPTPCVVRREGKRTEMRIKAK